MISIDEYILTQVTRDVCETMLGAALSDAVLETDVGPRLAASVRITGEADWTVEIETVPEVARHIASLMFSLAPAEVNESELRDALGEVVNMIGGNIKGIFCGESDLSIPRVEDRINSDLMNSTIATSIRLSYSGMPFVIRLLTV
ncbi:MAG: chemotaxis protein CheX [Planctomycetota bacterium]